jgi:FixJ family two-component response regulator
MKRILVAAAPFLAAALLVAGPAAATSKKVTCSQIRAELASGKKPSEVAKDLKVSKKTVDKCNAKVASSGKHTSHSSTKTTTQPAAQ